MVSVPAVKYGFFFPLRMERAWWKELCMCLVFVVGWRFGLGNLWCVMGLPIFLGRTIIRGHQVGGWPTGTGSSTSRPFVRLSQCQR